ncbi:cytochrome b [uncultured Roseibium sp.]|uniref:cytochrome b n=1 Tax=uncultured Roseibium sp. TaxID=1936171 RepID=UPI002633B70D|nr:cytochrome b [uncultured Roseibium sp.]
MSANLSRTASYDGISRFNHWIIAAAIIGMICFGFYLSEFVESGPGKGQMIGIHKAVGVLILIFGLWRVGYRLKQGFLDEASVMPDWQRLTAKLVHIVLLAGIIVMPISGIIGSYFGGRTTNVFGLFTIPAGKEIEALSGMGHWLHGAYGWLMVGALALHVAGALKHHLVDHDSTLTRMIRQQ